MQQKLDMTIIEQAKKRAGIATEANNAAAIRGITTQGGNYPEYAHEIENPKPQGAGFDASKIVPLASSETSDNKTEKAEVTYPENPYFNEESKLGHFLTYSPLREFERSQHAVFILISQPENEENYENQKTLQLFDFDRWLQVNRKYTEGFESAQLFGEVTSAKTIVTYARELWKRYQASRAVGTVVTENRNTAPTSIQEKLFVERLHCLYFWMWYTVISLQVTRDNEFNHFIELMETACCPIQLENVSIIVKALAGWQADDRDSYLGKLRPHFQNHLQVQMERAARGLLTCDCGKGLP